MELLGNQADGEAILARAGSQGGGNEDSDRESKARKKKDAEEERARRVENAEEERERREERARETRDAEDKILQDMEVQRQLKSLSRCKRGRGSRRCCRRR